MHRREDDRWALILAGGDGIRLRPLTRSLTGDERPKQFTSLFGQGTLLDHTRCRVANLAPPERIAVVVTRNHERFFSKRLMEAPGPLLIQAANRGTAPAILYFILTLRRQHPAATVAIFPSDHHFANEPAFIAGVRAAFRVIERHPDLIVILGFPPSSPAVDYDWIEPGKAMAGMKRADLLRIRRFWRNPPPAVASELLARGCLWNSQIVLGSADALLLLLQDAAPELYHSFEPSLAMLGTPAEAGALGRVYVNLAPSDFCADVLAPAPHALATLRVCETGWTDVADPSRTLSLYARVELVSGRTGALCC